jgi:deoxyribodipyrimidine photolyase
MSDRPSVVWFRCDLRLADNPALTAAVTRGGPVIPLFIGRRTKKGRGRLALPVAGGSINHLWPSTASFASTDPD